MNRYITIVVACGAIGAVYRYIGFEDAIILAAVLVVINLIHIGSVLESIKGD